MKKIRTQKPLKDSLVGSPRLLLGLVFVMLGIILGLVITILLQRSSSQQIATSIAGNDSITIEVEKVRRVPALTLRNEKISGNKQGLLLSLAIQNNTQKTQQFIPVSQLYVRFANSSMLHMTPLSGVVNPIAAGPVAPGDVVRGDVSFLIDASHYEGRLFFDGRWSGMAPVSLRLQEY